jgi:hypothetical protein
VIGLIGFAVGYMVGARAGQEGFSRLIDAAKSIASSDEFRGLVEGGASMLNSAVRQGAGTLAGDGPMGGQHDLGPRAA